MEPKISIIVIVKNDRGIEHTLAGLESQKKPAPTEIIVVDATEEPILADIRKKYRDVLWHQFIPRLANKTSIPEQRNFGIRAAKGNIIVFIDANCIPSEHWLFELTKPILDGHESMVAGSVRATDPKTHVNLNREDDKNDGYLTSSPTINLAFKKELWKEVGGFDESFLFGSDVDFTWRCHKAGNKIRFVRNAFVTHEWGGLQDEVKRSFRYGRARAFILKKHPELFRELFGGNLYILVYTLYFLGLPLTYYFWWYPFILFLAIAKNIGKHPFKMVFLNMIYTLGMWLEFLKMFSRTIFSNAAESSAIKSL